MKRLLVLVIPFTLHASQDHNGMLSNAGRNTVKDIDKTLEKVLPIVLTSAQTLGQVATQNVVTATQNLVKTAEVTQKAAQTLANTPIVQYTPYVAAGALGIYGIKCAYNYFYPSEQQQIAEQKAKSEKEFKQCLKDNKNAPCNDSGCPIVCQDKARDFAIDHGRKATHATLKAFSRTFDKFTHKSPKK